MPDIYLYEDAPVLRNKLELRDEKALDLIEAEQSRQNMMLLYERGFHDFSPEGLCEIHRTLFGDLYEWAGEYRVINIEKRERLLAGRSICTAMLKILAQTLRKCLTPFVPLTGRRWARNSLFRLWQNTSRSFGGSIRFVRATPGPSL